MRAACRPNHVDDEPTSLGMRDRYTDVVGLVHRNATGDFFLAPRELMHATQGYPELPQNIHVDGMMSFLGLAHGYGHLLLGNGCLIYHQMHARSTGFRPSVPINRLKLVAEAFIELGDLANIRPPGLGAAAGEASQARKGQLTYDGPTRQGEQIHVEWQTEEDKLGEPLPRTWDSWNDYKWGLALHELKEEELESRCVS